MKFKKSFLLTIAIGGVLFFLSECINTGIGSHDPRGNVYAGSASCRQCHQSIYDSFVVTSHYNTTRSPSAKNVLGSFAHGQNTFAFSDAVKVVMEYRDSGLFQVLYVNGKEHEAHRFDIAFGVKHAQTFLSWKSNTAFELPVSYYTAVNAWAASPGYSSTAVDFSRVIGLDCFECHSSFIKNDLLMSPKGVEDVLDKSTLVMGIDCERCHGPAINHVNYHRAYPEIREAKYILNPNTLSRQQKLDACAVCHSGSDRHKQVTTFQFRLGDTLANFFSPFGLRRKPDTGMDVHGHQYQLLSQSKCFLRSRTMECTTCHDPHTNASSDLSVYSKTCQGCHNNADHSGLKMDALTAKTITNNCIDCHMPEQPSRAISFNLAGSNTNTAYLMRTHRIAIYQDKKGNPLPPDPQKPVSKKAR